MGEITKTDFSDKKIIEASSMIDKVNRLFVWMVSVNYHIYLVVGAVIGLYLHFSGGKTSPTDQLIFLKNIGIPVVMYSLILRLFCQVFYQEKYDEFPFRKINHRRLLAYLERMEFSICYKSTFVWEYLRNINTYLIHCIKLFNTMSYME